MIQKIMPACFALLLLGLISLGTPLRASVPPFQHGDRVVFIGDSITHGGRYHADVYLYHATRFPDRPFVAHNCGISGDTAPGTNIRFESDIAVHRPTVATIMLGMNDAYAWAFDPSLPLQEKISAQASSYDHYTQAMDQMARTLAEMDCRMVFIKPSIYDQTAVLDQKNLFGKNDQLGRFSEYIDALAMKYDASVVDFYTPMSVINHVIQASDPSASIVGGDRVHPGIPGHLVMAYHFLKSQDMSPYVSAIQIDASEGGEILQLRNCEIHGDLVATAGQVSFSATEKALPFPLSPAQLKALDWVPFQHELNRQVLAVDNLPTGKYALSIDAIKVGEYSSVELKTGIDLSANPATPQYQQALQIKTLQNKQLQATGKLRSIALVRHSMVKKIKPAVSEKDHAALTIALATHLNKSKAEPWYKYLRQQADVYLETIQNEDKYKQEEVQWMQKMWQQNRPATHTWKLRKI
jgi:endoglucanase